MTHRTLPALFAASLIFAVPMAAVHAQGAMSGPEISFEKQTHDFGTVAYLSNGSASFEFTNTGKAPLIITIVRSSCGCLVPQWPKNPISPGARAEIIFRYDTARPGPINKTMTVTSNATNSPAHVLRIKGFVESNPGPTGHPKDY